MTVPTALEALPPSVGDAPVAALLLRDVLADLVAADDPAGEPYGFLFGMHRRAE